MLKIETVKLLHKRLVMVIVQKLYSNKLQAILGLVIPLDGTKRIYKG